MRNDENVRLRSIYSSSQHHDEIRAESALKNETVEAAVEAVENNVADDDKDEDEFIEEPILIPQSTHSFLFTENILSIPFFFSVVIAWMSFACLFLALTHNIKSGLPGNTLNIPVNVSAPVRGTQYIAILVALMMEEDIPTALYLLRKIHKKSFTEKLPGIWYGRFILSAFLRLALGYTFLINVLLVILQADDVLDIFYDVLALQFVQQIDDIAFAVAKLDVLGKSLKRAATKRHFSVEFVKSKFGRLRSMGFFLKIIYLINLFVALGALLYFTIKQESGSLQCNEISVSFGDEVWENAVVRNAAGNIEEMVLVYSFFSGVYVSDKTENGRPVYIERRKYDGTPYDSQVIPAEIKYCPEEQAWVFTHEHIRKSSKFKSESSCPWLMKSPETNEYDLLQVEGEWIVWKGIISHGAQISIICDECSQDTDCNLNGFCDTNTRECVCDESKYGSHCEHDVPCQLLKAASANDTWSLILEDEQYISIYDRPAYRYQEGIAEGIIRDEDEVILIYTGSRWFGALFENLRGAPTEYWAERALDAHAFWDDVYNNNTVIVSDPTKESTPVGVDFYSIGERGEQHGPFGVLYPLQDPPGRGAFHCIDPNTTKELNMNIPERVLRFRNIHGKSP